MRINLLNLLISFLNLYSIFSVEPEENESIQSSITKEFELTRTEIEKTADDEEAFLPYIFSSNIFEEGNYVVDTASFLSWKYDLTNEEIGDYSLINKKNENLKGTIKYNEGKMNFIKLNKDNENYKNKYATNFGAICIPKSVPERIKEEMITGNDNNDDINYSFLDLLNTELGENEKYINYIQDSINTGKITFGGKNEIFDSSVNAKEIKSCSCISPPNTDVENEYLNFWNCKIDSFFMGSLKFPASYSIALNGEIVAIFAIEEEYIIAPKITGSEIINYYKSLIDDNYDTSCEFQNFTDNTKIMLCKSFNFAELPDFNIILDGEIYLIALSFDLFKEKNDTHVYFKIILNEANTREYWYLGDPIIKNYNFLFNYTQKGNETVTIVQSDKYESMTIILFFCVSSFITLVFYIFIIIKQIKKIKNENYKFKDKDRRKQSEKIQRIIKNQNDFEVPEENTPVENINSNNYLTKENQAKEIFDFEDDNDSESINSSVNNLSNSYGKASELKTDKINRRNAKNIEIEMSNINSKMNYSDDEEEDLNVDDEGGIQAFNLTKLKKQ